MSILKGAGTPTLDLTESIQHLVKRESARALGKNILVGHGVKVNHLVRCILLQRKPICALSIHVVYVYLHTVSGGTLMFVVAYELARLVTNVFTPGLGVFKFLLNLQLAI